MTNTKKPLLNNNSSEGKTPSFPLNPIYRQLPTAADKEAFDKLKNSQPSVESHPHTFAWFALVSRFQEAVRNSWAAAGAAAKGGDKKPAAKKEEPKKEEKPAGGDDDLDLFGDDEPSEVSLEKIFQ